MEQCFNWNEENNIAILGIVVMVELKVSAFAWSLTFLIFHLVSLLVLCPQSSDKELWCIRDMFLYISCFWCICNISWIVNTSLHAFTVLDRIFFLFYFCFLYLGWPCQNLSFSLRRNKALTKANRQKKQSWRKIISACR